MSTIYNIKNSTSNYFTIRDAIGVYNIISKAQYAISIMYNTKHYNIYHF